MGGIQMAGGTLHSSQTDIRRDGLGQIPILLFTNPRITHRIKGGVHAFIFLPSPSLLPPSVGFSTLVPFPQRVLNAL
jgi:hypothetical protein